MGTLYYGDNLDVLKRYIDDESVDLVYLDPPFNSAQNYNAFFQEKDGAAAASQIQAFEDTWEWNMESEAAYNALTEQPGKVSEVMQAFRTFLGSNDMMAYLAMMAPRLVELRRVLKPSGSLYLHCDPTASHYLKILLDSVLGNFRNEIIWRRTNAHNSTTLQYGPIHDSILFYTKSDTFKFHPGVRPYSRAYIESRFVHSDSIGRYQMNYLTGPGKRNGESGLRWRGFDPTSAGRHWAVPKSLRQFLPDRGAGMSSHEQLESLFGQGFIVFPKKEGGQPMYKQYVGSGVSYQDLWAYQPNTSGVLFDSKECIDEDVKYLEDEQEKLGYPTQKPVGLLERILVTSTDAGDVVLDPFCGCGTTIDAAEKLGRKWIGIDITSLSTALIKSRLKDTYGCAIEINTVGEPRSVADAEQLASEDKYQFQWWALGLVGARPLEEKKGADKGIDGKILFRESPKDVKPQQVIFSVKGGGTGVKDIRDLHSVITRDKAAIGVLITMNEPTKPMKQEAAEAGFFSSTVWHKQYPRLQIYTVAELLTGAQVQRPPTLALDETYKRAPKAQNKPHEQQGLGI